MNLGRKFSRLGHELLAAIIGRTSPLFGVRTFGRDFPDHGDLMPSPVRNRPKPPRANSNGSCRL